MEINMARKMAWSFHKSTGIDYEELFSEACLAYCQAEADPNYNPYKAAITTFAWQRMRDHLRTYIKKEYHDVHLGPDNQNDPYEEIEFKDEVNNLSDEAKTICKMIFQSPHEYLDLSSVHARGKIKDQLREAGWSWCKIWNSFREIKSTLSQS